ncbi:MAG: HEPN domain-containing protein [Thermodesulfobacteriota bacterium]|nr:HEPN domain-containing protein [Thermodesulfobacteriota bacterium]
MKNETCAWISYASENLISAKMLLERNLLNPCLQNVQQSVEKYLKAFLEELQMLQNILTGYIENALAQAEYDKLEDGTFSGRIPSCKGVIAFGKTLRECENELQSTFEDWIFVGLKLGHTIPILAGYDLNKEPSYESMATV